MYQLRLILPALWPVTDIPDLSTRKYGSCCPRPVIGLPQTGQRVWRQSGAICRRRSFCSILLVILVVCVITTSHGEELCTITGPQASSTRARGSPESKVRISDLGSEFLTQLVDAGVRRVPSFRARVRNSYEILGRGNQNRDPFRLATPAKNECQKLSGYRFASKPVQETRHFFTTAMG